MEGLSVLIYIQVIQYSSNQEIHSSKSHPVESQRNVILDKCLAHLTHTAWMFESDSAT